MGKTDLFRFEREAKAGRPELVIAGVDEAGRGPLAGPVVAAAVILPPEEEFDLPVNDSKALDETFREELGERLRSDPRVVWAVAERSAAVIDRINILKATHEAMREAVLSLKIRPGMAFVDGLKVRDFPVEARFIVKGDALSASVAVKVLFPTITLIDIAVLSVSYATRVLADPVVMMAHNAQKITDIRLIIGQIALPMLYASCSLA
jgi:ribonuclease HII